MRKQFSPFWFYIAVLVRSEWWIVKSETWKVRIVMNKWMVSGEWWVVIDLIGKDIFFHFTNIYFFSLAPTVRQRDSQSWGDACNPVCTLCWGGLVFVLLWIIFNQHLPKYDVWKNIVTGGYVRKTTHQNMKYGKMLSQRSTCVKQPTKIWSMEKCCHKGLRA